MAELVSAIEYKDGVRCRVVRKGGRVISECVEQEQSLPARSSSITDALSKFEQGQALSQRDRDLLLVALVKRLGL